jgi:hypothetical protein
VPANPAKGQQAMAVAKIYPEPETLRRKGAGPVLKTGLTQSYVSHARTVLQYAPELTGWTQARIGQVLGASRHRFRVAAKY